MLLPQHKIGIFMPHKALALKSQLTSAVVLGNTSSTERPNGIEVELTEYI